MYSPHMYMYVAGERLLPQLYRGVLAMTEVIQTQGSSSHNRGTTDSGES